MGRTPYDAVARLTTWATEYDGYIRGALDLRGRPQLHERDAASALDVVMALAVDQYGPGALDKIAKQLREPFWLTEETWGMSADSVAAVEAMEAQMPLDTDDPEVAAYLERMRSGDEGTTATADS